jgi:hypothetical protein
MSIIYFLKGFAHMCYLCYHDRVKHNVSTSKYLGVASATSFLLIKHHYFHINIIFYGIIVIYQMRGIHMVKPIKKEDIQNAYDVIRRIEHLHDVIHELEDSKWMLEEQKREEEAAMARDEIERIHNEINRCHILLYHTPVDSSLLDQDWEDFDLSLLD